MISSALSCRFPVEGYYGPDSEFCRAPAVWVFVNLQRPFSYEPRCCEHYTRGIAPRQLDCRFGWRSFTPSVYQCWRTARRLLDQLESE